MRNNKKICYTSSYDTCICHKTSYNVDYENRNDLRLVSQNFSYPSLSVVLSQKDGKKNNVLWNGLQISVEQDPKRLLGRKEDARFGEKEDVAEPRGRFRKDESKVEGRKENRQRRLCSSFESPASLFGLSWVRSRTPVSIRDEFGQVFRSTGGSTS